MFEQESYDKATIQAASQPGELFHNYEIRNWVLSPTMYKLLALSAILNLAVLGFVAQTNLLTLRGCESPWVGRVCQVLDMAYVGAMIYGTDREFIDEAYDNIDLGEADITFIDVTGETPPLSYPEGYFQIANPVQYATLKQMSDNPAGIPNAFQQPYTPPSTLGGGEPDLMKIQPNPPAPNPNAFKDDSASPLFKVDNNTPNSGRVPRGKGRGGKIRPNGNTDANTLKPNETTVAESNSNAERTPQLTTPTDPITGVEINKRPIVDLGNWVNDKVGKKEVDLQTQFLVNVKGKLDKTGRLDPKTFSYVTAMSPDEDMVEVIKRSIEAINVAGYLQYLKDLSGKDFNFQLQQDTENISAVVQSEMESETRANSIKSGLNFLIGLAKDKKSKPEADQNDKDDLVLLENAVVETDGKKVVIKFTVPKAVAHPMIQRKLAEQAAANQNPSGLGPMHVEDNTAIK